MLLLVLAIFRIILQIELIIIVLSYFFIINTIAYIIYAYDKRQAIKNNYRVSEQFLLVLVVGGGMFGALLSMIMYRHKIKKVTFIVKYIIASVAFLFLLITYNQKISLLINEFLFFIKYF